MDTLPAEILLQIAARVPFEAQPKSSLQLVCQRFYHILDDCQRSVTKEIVNQQFSWAPRQFPGLFTSPEAVTIDRRQLARLLDRVATLTSIKAKCQTSRERGHTHHCAWTTKRSMDTYAAGLLILYRVSDAPPSKQAGLIQSMPKTSLAVLLFTLMMSVLLLRTVGPRMLHHCPHHHVHAATPEEREQRVRDRADLELACEELALQRGPDFILGLMSDRAQDVELLQDEFLHMTDRQMPDAHGCPPATTLIATVRCAFAKAAGCEVHASIAYMWDILEGDCADLLSDDKGIDVLERLINGEELEPVRRWCMACQGKV